MTKLANPDCTQYARIADPQFCPSFLARDPGLASWLLREQKPSGSITLYQQ